MPLDVKTLFLLTVDVEAMLAGELRSVPWVVAVGDVVAVLTSAREAQPTTPAVPTSIAIPAETTRPRRLKPSSAPRVPDSRDTVHTIVGSSLHA